MTTDITELAQREKFEVWAHSQKLSLAYGDCGYAFSSTEMAWRAWMASPAELVEALEKAQAAATQQGNIACALLDEVTQLRRHADEKAPELRALLIEADSELEVLRQRIAGLESRTVKLPAERFCPAEYAGSQLWSETEVWNKAITACADALRAAGIKVEAE